MFAYISYWKTVPEITAGEKTSFTFQPKFIIDILYLFFLVAHLSLFFPLTDVFIEDYHIPYSAFITPILCSCGFTLPQKITSVKSQSIEHIVPLFA